MRSVRGLRLRRELAIALLERRRRRRYPHADGGPEPHAARLGPTTSTSSFTHHHPPQPYHFLPDFNLPLSSDPPLQVNYIAGEQGVDACPSGYNPIYTVAECMAASDALGYNYESSLESNVGGTNSLCAYCGFCSPVGSTVFDTHGSGARWLCSGDAHPSSPPPKKHTHIHTHTCTATATSELNHVLNHLFCPSRTPHASPFYSR